jgi:transposase
MCAPTGRSPDPTPVAAAFFYSRNRAGRASLRLCRDLAGRCLCGFGELYDGGRKPGPITEAVCWSHARRHFFELADLRKAPLAVEAVRRIDEHFTIERRINGLPASDRPAQLCSCWPRLANLSAQDVILDATLMRDRGRPYPVSDWGTTSGNARHSRSARSI